MLDDARLLWGVSAGPSTGLVSPAERAEQRQSSSGRWTGSPTGFALPRAEIRFTDDRDDCRAAPRLLRGRCRDSGSPRGHERDGGSRAWSTSSRTGGSRRRDRGGERFRRSEGSTPGTARTSRGTSAAPSKPRRSRLGGRGSGDGTRAPSFPRNSPRARRRLSGADGRPLPELEGWMTWEGSTGGPR